MDELDRLGWAVRRSYRFGNSYLGIRTNSESFGAWLDQTLAGHRSRKKPDYFHYSVLLANGSPKAAGRRFHILYRETLMVQRTFHLPTVGRTLLAELEAILARDRDDQICVDAAILTLDGVTALVPMMMVAFLATLGRRAERTGLVFPTQTSSMIDLATGYVVPFPDALGPVSDPATELEDGTDPAAGAGRLVVREPLSVDVLCSIGVGDLVAEVSKATALYRLATHVMNLQKVGRASLPGLAKLVERARCFEVRSAKPPESLEAVLLAMREGPGAS